MKIMSAVFHSERNWIRQQVLAVTLSSSSRSVEDEMLRSDRRTRHQVVYMSGDCACQSLVTSYRAHVTVNDVSLRTCQQTDSSWLNKCTTHLFMSRTTARWMIYCASNCNVAWPARVACVVNIVTNYNALIWVCLRYSRHTAIGRHADFS